jgi:hypothetical protein
MLSWNHLFHSTTSMLHPEHFYRITEIGVMQKTVILK